MEKKVFTCISCGKQMEDSIEDVENTIAYLIGVPEHLIEESTFFEDYGGINGAVHAIISAGYGSEFDGHDIEIVICDDCIKSKCKVAHRLDEKGNFLW
jgi:hypothetical protein